MLYDHQMPVITLHNVIEIKAERNNHGYFATTKVSVWNESRTGLKAVLFHDPDMIVELKVRKRTDAEKKKDAKDAKEAAEE